MIDSRLFDLLEQRISKMRLLKDDPNLCLYWISQSRKTLDDIFEALEKTLVDNIKNEVETLTKKFTEANLV